MFECSPKPRITASGRDGWAGWVELKTEPLPDEAITNTARAIAEVNPDILALVEVESRPAVQHFHDKVLRPLLKEAYPYNMVIDGNDEGGIDVGGLSRYPVQRMRSHIADVAGNSRIFSRDYPEYYLELPSGRELLLLPNHFASKGNDATGQRRRVQASAVRTIYQSLSKRYPYAVVAGDLYDYPQSSALAPLVRRTNLRDAMPQTIPGGIPRHLPTRHRQRKDRLPAPFSSPARESASRRPVSQRLLCAAQVGFVREHQPGEQGPLSGLRPSVLVGRDSDLTRFGLSRLGVGQ